MNITEFKDTYATNTHRLALFEEFLKFIEKANDFLHPYQVVVYGSYITNKPNPSDIDVILQGYVKKEKWDEFNLNTFRLDGPVHVKSFTTKSMVDECNLKPIETIVNDFSNTEENKIINFHIASHVQITF